MEVARVRILEEDRCHYCIVDEAFSVKDNVVVETDRNIQLGVIEDIKDIAEKDIGTLFSKIVRKATKKDCLQYSQNREDAVKALNNAISLAKNYNLTMRFIDASFNLDRSQLLFHFVADARVDFRELAKKLAQIYKTRIELRQIGVRDKAKKIGGLGPCGLFLCCSQFLTDFNSVSINMAKNQLLALNPTKINGSCGRLLCCLNYEDEVYTELKKGMPQVGRFVETPNGNGKVISVNLLKQTYQVLLSNNEIMTFTKEDNHGSLK